MVTEDSSKQVYIFENVLYPILKIGISNNPLKRKTTIENASGFPLNLIYESEPVKRPMIVEALIHKKLSEYRQKGEWFIIDKESAIKEIEEVIKESQLGEYKDLSKDFQLERECVKVLDYHITQEISTGEYVEVEENLYEDRSGNFYILYKQGSLNRTIKFCNKGLAKKFKKVHFDRICSLK